MELLPAAMALCTALHVTPCNPKALSDAWLAQDTKNPKPCNVSFCFWGSRINDANDGGAECFPAIRVITATKPYTWYLCRRRPIPIS